MRIEQLQPDLYLAIGDAYDSNSTVILSDRSALLIESTGGKKDAQDLKQFVEVELLATVQFIVLTHYFSDHLAGLKLFPESQIIAHRNYRHTVGSEMYLTEEERSFFVEPSILISDEMSIRWGRYHVNLFYNPGHTMSTVNIDIPEADLVHAGDTIVGNMVYFWYSTPGLLSTALERLQRARRKKLISSHLGIRSTASLDHAIFYLTSLRSKVEELGRGSSSILEIDLQDCLPAEVIATPFENIFHKRNLKSILKRDLFTESF